MRVNEGIIGYNDKGGATMTQNELLNAINDIEREIALMPIGSITKKKIKDKEYYYHRINRDGKRTESYIPFDEVEELREQIEKRKSLEKRLKEYRKLVIPDKNAHDIIRTDNGEKLLFHTIVRCGRQLESQIRLAETYKKRECISDLRDYIFGNVSDKVFVIYGLRRTGKTTMIRQILAELPTEEFDKAAFIQLTAKDTLADLDEDIRLLEDRGYKYLFIDEVTLLEDFIESAAIFADIYASSGMKIVLSGTDSLGFAFSREEQLYDRCIMVHTTFIPYREFEEVLGIEGIDEYIRFGGTMSIGGVNYNENATFATAKSAEAYIDTAIAKNIQHSLKMYEYGGHFRGLLDLYEHGELTNVINRVIENINHSFTRSVVERKFKSHDLSVTASNMLRDREQPMNIKNHMDLDSITYGMMQMLDIINKEEQSIDIEDGHMTQIKEYLELLDLIVDIDLEYLPETGKGDKLTVISQPGMRYAQAEAIVENLLLDVQFNELNVQQRKLILDRLLEEVKGRMMEEIVLLETKFAYPDKKVFKLQFAVGEYDMVIFDSKKLNCELYEIKHSKEQVAEQYRHLIDEAKCELVSHRYGDIKGRYVIYRGEAAKVDNVQYINVEKYLKSLGKDYN